MDDTSHDQILYDYYDRRAPWLEQQYQAGTWAAWVQTIVADMQQVLRGRHVLEIACGTGHWTAFAAAAAEYIVGIDVSPNMLAFARQKALPPEKVLFSLGDGYAPDRVPGTFDAGLAMQWFSHTKAHPMIRDIFYFLLFFFGPAGPKKNNKRATIPPSESPGYMTLVEGESV